MTYIDDWIPLLFLILEIKVKDITDLKVIMISEILMILYNALYCIH